MPTPPEIPSSINLYTILSLPTPQTGRTVSTSEIRAAYRRALLKYHPDKAANLLQDPSCIPDSHTENGAQQESDGKGESTSIDNILLARDILTSPTSRRKYDLSLRTTSSSTTNKNTASSTPLPHPTELETLDLDDMTHHVSTNTWTKTCRCGNVNAYEVSEADLEAALACGGGSGSGEVLVGCEGCSLHVVVGFGVVDDEGEGDGDGDGGA